MHDELTANDIKKMEDEIEYRKLVVRKKALDDVKVARAQGDLSENFEYKAAKQFKNQNESRIRYLEKMIKTAVVISDESKDDEVGMFNTVDVYFEDDDETVSKNVFHLGHKYLLFFCERDQVLCQPESDKQGRCHAFEGRASSVTWRGRTSVHKRRVQRKQESVFLSVQYQFRSHLQLYRET